MWELRNQVNDIMIAATLSLKLSKDKSFNFSWLCVAVYRADHLNCIDLTSKCVLASQCPSKSPVPKMAEHLKFLVTAQQHTGLPLEMSRIPTPINSVLWHFFIAVMKLWITLLIFTLVKLMRSTAHSILLICCSRLKWMCWIAIMENLPDQCMLFMYS